MEKILIASLIFAVTAPAYAECRTYKAPPESRFAGSLIQQQKSTQWVALSGPLAWWHCEGTEDGQEPTGATNCDVPTQDIDVSHSDDFSAIIWVKDDNGDGIHLWPAACDD